MKCERCGKEANVYYRSNVNGKVTNVNLCSECAEKHGEEMGMKSMDTMFGNMDSMFSDMYNDMFGMFRGLMNPMSLSPWGNLGMMMPRSFMPRIHIMLEPTESSEAKTAEPKPQAETKVDPEMAKRREINALREQMKLAVENEEFEKAAELRDKIRGLDNRANG